MENYVNFAVEKTVALLAIDSSITPAIGGLYSHTRGSHITKSKDVISIYYYIKHINYYISTKTYQQMHRQL